jgi:menaquinone-specific isochorismate synthase
MSLHWSSPTRALSGAGNLQRFDPGIDRSRYNRALAWLADIGRDLAFASFTFDPVETGSVVLAPQRLESNPVASGNSVDAGIVASGRTEWERGFGAMSEALAMGAVEKVVLARQMSILAPTAIDIDAVFMRLQLSNPQTYVFAIEGLVGASPELLVSVVGGTLRSVALAGTSTGSSALDDPMIILEHELAASSVRDGLNPHMRRIESQQSVIEVGRMRHLATSFEGDLAPGKGVMDILSTLHPTAAVAGTPTAAALDLIRGVEPTRRGRYAGPVGWFDREGNGEFAIALRCGQVDGSRATLYAGGGLVAGADIDQEWAETDAKLQPMIEALGIV